MRVPDPQACAPPCPVSRGTRCTFSSARVLNILSPAQRARCSPGATPGHHILQIRFYQQQQQGLVFVTETKWPAKSKTFITWPLKGKTWQQPCRAHPPSASRALTRLPCTARLCRRVSAHKTLQQRHSRSHGFTSAPALASRQRPGSHLQCRDTGRNSDAKPSYHHACLLHFLEGGRHFALSEVTWSVEFKYLELSKIMCYYNNLTTGNNLLSASKVHSAPFTYNTCTNSILESCAKSSVNIKEGVTVIKDLKYFQQVQRGDEDPDTDADHQGSNPGPSAPVPEDPGQDI